MSFVFAFIIGGIACALGTLIASPEKIPDPVALIAFIVIGGILTPLGVIDKLTTLGAGGVSLFAYGFGNAGFSTGALLKSGNPVPFLMVLVLLVILIALGALCGIKKKQ